MWNTSNFAVTTGDAAKANYNVGRLLFMSILFCMIFIDSIFDCYFTDPVVNGMESFSMPQPEAKRLVLIVGKCHSLIHSGNIG
jgi:phosphatidylinositol glycan class N